MPVIRNHLLDAELPGGWYYDVHITPKEREYKMFHGPNGEVTDSKVKALRLALDNTEAALAHLDGKPAPPSTALPGRDNRVLSRAPRFAAEGARVFDRLDAALACPQGEAVWVFGGGELYAALLPRATRLYLTEVDAAPEGDTWFPALDPAQWQEVARTHHAADERHAAAFDFVDYVRRLPGEQ